MGKKASNVILLKVLSSFMHILLLDLINWLLKHFPGKNTQKEEN